MKKSLVLFLFLIMVLSFSACSNKKNDKQGVDFKTQTIKLDNAKFDIPENWEETVDPSGMTQHLYIPKGNDLAKGTSNVTLFITKTNKIATPLDEMKKNIDSFQQQIKVIFPEATNIKFDDFTVPSGTVFSLEYMVPLQTMTMKQTQFYLLLDNYAVVVTSTDINDGVAPIPATVATHIVNSFSLTSSD